MTRLLPPVLAALGLFACSTSNVASTAPIPVTAIGVDPAQFLNGVACLDAPGAMRLYVATLRDHSRTTDIKLPTDAGAQIVLPSSPPTPCFEQVDFERIVVGRQYVADIEGYDRTDIEPLGCWPKNPPNFVGCSGSPVMVDKATGAFVAPRWTTSCGLAPVAVDAGTSLDGGPRPPIAPGVLDAGYAFGDCRGIPYRDGSTPNFNGPVCAETEATVIVRGCAPLVESTTSPTGVTVDLSDALANQPCAASGVQTFDVKLGGASGPTKSATCGGSVEFDGLTPGKGYTFDVEAVGADGGPRTLTTTCFATTTVGSVVRAACDPFPELHAG